MKRGVGSTTKNLKTRRGENTTKNLRIRRSGIAISAGSMIKTTITAKNALAVKDERTKETEGMIKGRITTGKEIMKGTEGTIKVKIAIGDETTKGTKMERHKETQAGF